MNDRILLIRTGGTIDAEPYEDPTRPPQFVNTLKDGNSLVMQTVATLPHHEKVDGLSWGHWEESRFVKDSQLFTKEDLLTLADTIKADAHRYFLITHGTDAMVKNAAVLQEALQGTDKVVVLTGAMVPLSMQSKHGGTHALAFTLENMTHQPAGLYIAGQDSGTKRLAFFDPKQVEKDREASLASASFMLKARGRGN